MEYAAPIPGFEQYTVTPNGEVFCGNRLLKHWEVPGRAARVKLRNNEGKIIRMAVAKLIALTFIANPQNHSRIIFKDRNKNNCTVDNIMWVSASECTRFAQHTIESEELERLPVCHSKEPERVRLEEYPGYSITADGEAFNGNYLLKASQSPGRAARAKVRDKEGKSIRIAIAKLIALAYIPNPDNHSKIIFKDRDKNNCTVGNIQWVSTGEFTRFVNHHAESDNLLGPPRPKRKPDWIDPARVPLEGYPGYYLTPAGVLYKGDRICKPSVRKNKSTRVRIWQQGRYKFFGLAKLVAEHFIPNPKNHRYIIFKDRDNHNCHVSNIAWVDAETFTFYCGIHVGAKKRVLSREEAIRRCTNIYLRAYYETLDESWLHDCWAEVEERIKLPDWDACKSDCYLYFIDRARRFSLLRDPVGLMVVHMRGVRAKIRKEISPNMPVMAVVRTDESLRNFNLLQITGEHIGKSGVVGESGNRLLMYIIYTYRKATTPLHIICLASSGTGKTHLQEKVGELIPEEDKIEITTLSENAFYYFGQRELKHKLIMIEDLDGAENVLYPLRELMSKKRISKTIAIKSKSGETKTIHLIVEGPVAVSGCTTKESIYEDNANRSFLLYLDESKGQDNAVMDYQRKLRAGKIDTAEENSIKELFKNCQRILEPVRVLNPYAEFLTIPEEVLKPRRSNDHYLLAIEAITFYHQCQREKKADGKRRIIYRSNHRRYCGGQRTFKRCFIKKKR